MFFTGFSMKLGVVLSGFIFHVTCHDSHRECFDNESRTICYFMPSVSSVDWDTAWKTCKELDATLPVILSEKGQTVLGDYLSKHFPVETVWTAGRYVGNESEWRWLNGQDFSGTEKPPCPNNKTSCSHETQAVLTKDLIYRARYPDHPFAFICSFPAVHCTTESQNSISWNGACLHWRKKYSLRLNEARNECLKGGGDLATFSDKGDLDRIQQVSTLKDDTDNGYWIGLHRKWWIWNTTDVHDIKYNLLGEYGEIRKDCLFINESSKWTRDDCSMKKTVICQTVLDSGETASSTMSIIMQSTSECIMQTVTQESSYAVSQVLIYSGVGAGIVIIIICIIIIILAVRHTGKSPKKMEQSKGKNNSEQNKRNESPNKSTISPATSPANAPANAPVVRADDSQGLYAEISLATLNQPEDRAKTEQPGIVYAALEFQKEPTYLEPDKKRAHATNATKVGPMGDVIYAMPDAKGHAVTSPGNESASHPSKVTQQGDVYALPIKNSKSPTANPSGGGIYENL